MQLVYDADCPVCSAYRRSLQAPAAVPVRLPVDARGDTPVLREITRRGPDLDEGLVLLHLPGHEPF